MTSLLHLTSYMWRTSPDQHEPLTREGAVAMFDAAGKRIGSSRAHPSVTESFVAWAQSGRIPADCVAFTARKLHHRRVWLRVVGTKDSAGIWTVSWSRLQSGTGGAWHSGWAVNGVTQNEPMVQAEAS